MTTDMFHGYENNPSARAIILNAYKKAKRERFGGYWTRVFEELTGIDSDRTPYDTGMCMEITNQE